MRIIGIKDVMEMTGLGRPTVTQMLREPTCPTLPRSKNRTYRVEEGAFLLWFNNVHMKKKK